MCAGVYAVAGAAACSSSSPNLPPIEPTGTPGAACGVGNACSAPGAYCLAGGPACKYLECVGSTWQCPPDAAAPSLDASAGADAFEAGADGPGAVDATDAVAPESGTGDAARD